MSRTDDGVYLNFEDFATPYEVATSNGASPTAGDAPRGDSDAV